jgi:hypothetical protein
MRAWLVALIAACSSGPEPVHPTPDPGHGSAEAPIADAECSGLVSHAVELRVAELHASNAGSALTDADQAQVRDQSQTVFGANCRKLSRAAYRCAIAATTFEAFVACDR